MAEPINDRMDGKFPNVIIYDSSIAQYLYDRLNRIIQYVMN